ncbi:RBBP9/YdeN family alpha/beta hydrolase [Streptomyces peucetius]|uniref:Alpha/beta hydrolase n=1 Tax=Streptomyces peucetius TaxID=1950 RepID=A0ABY6IGL9_STRPE|nr:alpha/beta hydrolase [Streptomyces peucetius]UYQ65325.1 alpha/beta hydrolase [Streptomyces peucetius]
MTAQPRSSFLVLPGYQGSGPEHWQSRWEAADPSFRRVQQADWDRPVLGDWLEALDEASAAAQGPVVLVAHSLGCILVAHWAAERSGRSGQVAGALLVAPADIERAGVAELENFCPVPLKALPFPSIVVAASDDPWCTPERSRRFADAWDARLVEAGPLGHINAESGLGDWPAGRELLTELLPG